MERNDLTNDLYTAFGSDGFTNTINTTSCVSYLLTSADTRLT